MKLIVGLLTTYLVGTYFYVGNDFVTTQAVLQIGAENERNATSCINTYCRIVGEPSIEKS